MGRPLRVRVRRSGHPSAAGYLEALLRLHGFHVLDDEEGGGDGGAGGPDAVLVAAARPPRAQDLSGDLPLIVIPGWRPDPLEAAALVAAGAEDVLPVEDLSAPRLEAAVRKAVVRRARAARAAPAPRPSLREALALPAPAAPPLSAWVAAAPAGFVAATPA